MPDEKPKPQRHLKLRPPMPPIRTPEQQARLDEVKKLAAAGPSKPATSKGFFSGNLAEVRAKLAAQTGKIQKLG